MLSICSIICLVSFTKQIKAAVNKIDIHISKEDYHNVTTFPPN